MQPPDSFPVFKIDPQSVTNLAVIEEIRLLSLKVDKFEAIIDMMRQSNLDTTLDTIDLFRELDKAKDENERLRNWKRKAQEKQKAQEQADHESEEMKKFHQGFAYRKPRKK